MEACHLRAGQQLRFKLDAHPKVMREQPNSKLTLSIVEVEMSISMTEKVDMAWERGKMLEYMTNLLEQSMDPFLTPSIYLLLSPNPYSYVLRLLYLCTNSLPISPHLCFPTTRLYAFQLSGQ